MRKDTVTREMGLTTGRIHRLKWWLRNTVLCAIWHTPLGTAYYYSFSPRAWWNGRGS